MRIDFDAVGSAGRRLLVVGAVGLLASPGHSGSVPVPGMAACCTGAATLGDTMINASGGGDKEFFEVPSTPPGAIFLLGNNASMQDYTRYLPEVGDTSKPGCSDPVLVDAMKWFDRGSADPALNGSIPFDADPDFSTPETHFFDPDKYYHSRGRRLAWQVEEGPYSLAADMRSTVGFTDLMQVCGNALEWGEPWGSPVYTECQRCLTERGWWRGPLANTPVEPPTGTLPVEARRKWILSGRVLNVRPPKFVVARKVLKDVLSTVDGLRMGVATFGPDQGWFDPPVLLRPLKPSCDKSHPLLDETALGRAELRKAINSISFRNDERSIGEAVFGLGGYFSSQKVDGRWAKWFTNPLHPGWGWPGCCNGGTVDDPLTGQDGRPWGSQSPDEWLKNTQPWEGTGQDRSVCSACQASSIIVLADGAPRYDNSVPLTKMMEVLKARGVKHPDGTPLTFDPSNPETNPAPGGVNYCDEFGATKEDCDYANWPTGLAKTNKNFMDDVAFFLANADLRDDLAGDQSVRTYTIGYGDNSPMLQSIAKAGKGRFFRANDAGDLRDALMAALGDVKEVSTAFASASVASVQAGGSQSSFVPRFTPRRGRPYEGHLYRFFFFSEFTQGCVAALAKSPAGDPRDLNGDKDCDDSFFLDRPAGFTTAPGAVPDISSFTRANIVQENTEGSWVKVQMATLNSEGRLVGGTPAQPFWDLAETLGKRGASAPCDPTRPTGGRCVFTLVDRDKDGRFTDADNPPMPFDLAHRGELEEYLLAAGDGFCAGAFAKLKKAWTGTPVERTECVDTLIRFVRGADVFDYDGDLRTNEDRPCSGDTSRSCKLADIFHSTPVTVEPPIEPLLCTLGLSGQCLSTLYEDFTASVSSETSCATPAAGRPCYAPTPMDPPRGSSTNRYGAYDVFRKAHAKRERIVLVGSNGGMLHAVHAGSPLARDKASALDDVHDLGTGQELWSFIPPDLLPKLGLMMNGHEYYVDGTAMVRDIWADGSASSTGTANDVKEPGEFHTVAILTERSGGQRFVALDVTDPREMLKPDGKPFRWMFPNACDAESGAVGQSWTNFAPKPPPIGPVRLAKGNARGWEERWVAVLNGGYSADLSRGRGVYMLDAWTGDRLWSAEARPGVPSPDAYTNEVLNRMLPIAAAPALVDIGEAENVRLDLDGFFDTLVVGDLGGQVWTFRFHTPGVLGSDGQVNNWFGARSLEMARGGGSFQKLPFFHMASNVRQPETGWLRSFLGTGDRQHLRSKEGTNCGPDDLLACVRMKCDVEAELTADINGLLRKSVIEYDNGVLVKSTESVSGSAKPVCTSARMELTRLRIQCDKDTALGSGSYYFPALGATEPASTDAECARAGGGWSCTLASLPTDSHGDLNLGTDADKVPHNRYFGFHAYGGWQRHFQSAAEAIAFDHKRVTDGGFDCGAGVDCSLVDVTIPDSAYTTYVHPTLGTLRYVPTSTMASLPRGTQEGPGWYLRYGGLQEKTAAGSAVLGGIVFWPSLSPPPGTTVSACKVPGGGDISRSWQADVITGLPDQADGFRVTDKDGHLLGYVPARARDAWAPPPEPAAVVSVSATGGIRYEVVMPGVGQSPVTETLRERQNTAPDISWLEVPRNLHACRHADTRFCR